MLEDGDANHNKNFSHYISSIRESFSLLEEFFLMDGEMWCVLKVINKRNVT